MANIICARCGDRPATHALCNLALEATDGEGSRVFEYGFVYCGPCSEALVEEDEAEKCPICEDNDSVMVDIEHVKFKPLYLAGELDEQGYCLDHP